MPVRMGQFGVQHGHAAGKAAAMRANSEVELVGIFEPDGDARERAQGHRAYTGVRWYESVEQMLGDPSIAAVAVEGRNDESLPMARACVEAGKHIWYDKPAGDDWTAFQEVVAIARRRNLIVQMGYMFRYNDGYQMIGEWARSGLLGDVFGIRAHMSTWIPVATEPPSAFTRSVVADHPGGILYDLGGHVLDQVLWVMRDERPARITSFLRNDATPDAPECADNTLAVVEFQRAMAMVDIAAVAPRPSARRFEVYGTQGSAILDPMEPPTQLRLCLEAAAGGFEKGAQTISLSGMTRQRSYELELAALLPTVQGQRAPDRTLDHELLVQETLLRATGRIPGG